MADSITAAIQTQIMNLETEVSDLATRVAALEKLLQDYPPHAFVYEGGTLKITPYKTEE